MSCAATLRLRLHRRKRRKCLKSIPFPSARVACCVGVALVARRGGRVHYATTHHDDPEPISGSTPSRQNAPPAPPPPGPALPPHSNPVLQPQAICQTTAQTSQATTDCFCTQCQRERFACVHSFDHISRSCGPISLKNGANCSARRGGEDRRNL